MLGLSGVAGVSVGWPRDDGEHPRVDHTGAWVPNKHGMARMRSPGVRTRQDGVRSAVPPRCPGPPVWPRPFTRRVPRHGPQTSTDRPASARRH